MGRSSIFVLRAIVVALLLTGSSALALWTGGSASPSPTLSPVTGSLPTASTAGATSIPNSILPAASTWEAQAAADQERYSTIASDLEARGVRADLIHLPSSEPVGYIAGKLVPGPEYGLDESGSGISQGSSAPPAPAGIAYYGESGNDSGPEEQTTSLDTSILAGTLNVQNLTTLYLDSDNPDQYGVQLNAVLVNLSLQGQTNNDGTPYDLWTQNVMSYQDLNRTLSFVENTWNFSSSSADFPSGHSTVVASDVNDSNSDGVYVGQGPSLNAPPPFNLTLYLNTSLINPFVCTPESTVYLSSTCSNAATGTADYAGDQTLFYNYTFYDDKTHYFTSGTYDWLTFHSGKGSVLDKSNKRLAGFEASGNLANPEDLSSDWELDVGVGAFDGADQNVFNGSGTATLDYVGDCTHPTAGTPSNCHPSATSVFKPVPSALNFGSETGECSDGISVVYTKTAASFSAGPLDLLPLWGYAQEKGVASGATAVTNAITVSGSPLAISAQPYIFVFLEDLSVGAPAPAFAWAPDVPTWYLMPGKYDWEAMLADYTEKSGSLTVGTTPKTLTAVLPYHHAAGVYTPLWALDNAQL
ncbi:MAG: thermopsin family protease, partial [Thermoplasmata archaeon]